MPVFFNLLFFKLVWAASLAGVVLGYAWLGLLALGFFLTWHGWKSPTAQADFFLIVVAIGAGLLFDTVYIRSGLIAYEGTLLWQSFAPLWILGLWANFALTMNGCLKWLQERRWLAALLAATCGPASYFGGITLGTARITGDPLMLYGSIGVAWAITLPLLLTLASRLTVTLHPEIRAKVQPVPDSA